MLNIAYMMIPLDYFRISKAKESSTTKIVSKTSLELNTATTEKFFFIEIKQGNCCSVVYLQGGRGDWTVNCTGA